MYYILLGILFIVVYYVLVKVLSSVVKGCFTSLLIFIVVIGGYVFLKSTKEPIYIFNVYKVDNFKIERLN